MTLLQPRFCEKEYWFAGEKWLKFSFPTNFRNSVPLALSGDESKRLCASGRKEGRERGGRSASLLFSKVCIRIR